MCKHMTAQPLCDAFLAKKIPGSFLPGIYGNDSIS